MHSKKPKSFLAKRLVESTGILFSALLVFSAIVYAYTTWAPGNPPQAAPGDGNVELESFWTKNGPAKIFYNSGDVGIGTSSPGAKLEVSGNIKASGTICDSVGCIGSGGTSLWSASGSNVYYNSGNVGIGTTSPTAKLEVDGDIKASGTVCDSNGCISESGISSCWVSGYNNCNNITTPQSGDGVACLGNQVVRGITAGGNPSAWNSTTIYCCDVVISCH